MTPEERAARVDPSAEDAIAEVGYGWDDVANGTARHLVKRIRALEAELDRVTAQEEETAKAFEVLMHDMAEERDAAIARAEKAEARLLGAQAELDDLRKYLARDRTERDAALAQVKQLREALTGQVRVLFTDYGACFCGPYSGQHSAACAAAKAALSATEPKP